MNLIVCFLIAANINASHESNHSPAAAVVKASTPSAPPSSNEFFQLPQKFVRRPIAVDEMDAINVSLKY